jgi:hypothetical protein
MGGSTQIAKIRGDLKQLIVAGIKVTASANIGILKQWPRERIKKKPKAARINTKRADPWKFTFVTATPRISRAQKE